jgi:hypothetical protein
MDEGQLDLIGPSEMRTGDYVVTQALIKGILQGLLCGFDARGISCK